MYFIYVKCCHTPRNVLQGCLLKLKHVLIPLSSSHYARPPPLNPQKWNLGQPSNMSTQNFQVEPEPDNKANSTTTNLSHLTCVIVLVSSIIRS